MKFSQDFKEIPYWLDPPPLTKSFYTHSLPASTDVLVIGSGYTGTTAAIRLKQAGLQVALIDKLKLGTAASSRNGGMTLTGLSKGLAKTEEKLGREKAQQLFAESLASIAAVERLVAEGNIDCDFQRRGHLETAFKPAHFERLKRDHEFLHNRYHHKTRIISPAELKTEIDADLYHGALLDPASAGLHPAKYIAGLVTMADTLGVKLCEEVCAEAIEHRTAGFKVRTNRGTIAAEEIIVATNGYTGPLTPWLARRLVPTESLMIATEELPAAFAASLIPRGRMIYDTKIFLFYFRLSPDGRRLLFGGRPKSPYRTLRENSAAMHRNMLRVFPRLKDVAITHAWSGKIGFTLDRLPHIGKHDGVYYSLGYCGHGVALATYLGEKLAAMVQGQDPATAFADLRFRPIPLYNGDPWFQPLIYAYFSLLDRIV